MNKEFERIERVREILSKYKWFFDVNCNQYVLESYASDIRAVCASNYLDGLWWMFQESRKQIQEQQNKIDSVLNKLSQLQYSSGERCYNEIKELLK